MSTRLPTALHAPVDDPVTDLVVTTLNAANAHTLNVWAPATYPTGVVLPSTTEAGVRPPAAAALGLAAALAAGVHDEAATSTTTDQARARAVELVAAVAGAHRTSTVGGWGAGWQTALWAYLAGAAGWLLWAHLDAPTRARVLGMITDEADRIATLAPPVWTATDGTVLTPGDSKAEENAWNASVLALAALVAPVHPQVTTWTTALVTWAVSAHATRADVLAPVTVNGLSTATLPGWNVFDDGTVVNHDLIHPDYMVAAAASLWGAQGLYGAGDALWPVAGTYGAHRVYAALHHVHWDTRGPIYQPDGTVLYPQGTDWGTLRYADKIAADVIAWRYGWGGPNARTAALAHLQLQADLQARTSTGATYVTPTEDLYPGREQWVAHHLAHALIALCADVTESNTAPAHLTATNATRGDLDGETMPTPTPLHGEVTFTGVGQTSYSQRIDFPPGAFTTTPTILVGALSGTGGTGLCASAEDRSATGFVLRLWHAQGVTFAATTAGRGVSWVALPKGAS